MAVEQHYYTIGRAQVTRIEELVLSNFTPAALFPDWDPLFVAAIPELSSGVVALWDYG
jgi:hypothetical protein